MCFDGATVTSCVTPFAVALAMAVVGTARAADYPTTILADKPSAYYRFEELPGSTTAADSSGNGVTATTNTTTLAFTVQ